MQPDEKNIIDSPCLCTKERKFAHQSCGAQNHQSRAQHIASVSLSSQDRSLLATRTKNFSLFASAYTHGARCIRYTTSTVGVRTSLTQRAPQKEAFRGPRLRPPEPMLQGCNGSGQSLSTIAEAAMFNTFSRYQALDRSVKETVALSPGVNKRGSRRVGTPLVASPPLQSPPCSNSPLQSPP